MSDRSPPPAEPRRSWVPVPSPLAVVLALSGLAWLVLFAAVPPLRQNFPLNDDWAYARGAFLFARGEGIHYGSWASMPQLGQWLWACPFVWLLGPSHVALRIATIFLSWLGLWAFFDLLRQQGWAPRRAALAVASLTFFPLFFLLQGTFLTDVPTLSLALLSLALYGRAFQGQRAGWLAGGCAVGILAALTRQNAVAVAAAVAVLLWRQPDLRRRPAWWLAVGLPFTAGLGIHFWFQARSDIIPVAPRVLQPDRLLLLPFLGLHWCGLAALPLLLNVRPRSWTTFAWALLILLACAGYWRYQGLTLEEQEGFFPYTGPTMTIYGAGSGEMNPGERPLLLGLPLRRILSLLGCLGGALLLERALAWRRRREQAGPLLLFAACQLPFLLVAPAVWDRYLLPLFPAALYLAGAGCRTDKETPALAARQLPGLGTVAVLGVVSVLLMHDWLSWNAASWELGRRALGRHIAPLDVEGGLEWDGWHSAASQAPRTLSWRELFLDIERRAGPPKGLALPHTRVWFPQVHGRYALSFTRLPGTVVLDEEPYAQWLLPGKHQFFLVALPSARPAEAETK